MKHSVCQPKCWYVSTMLWRGLFGGIETWTEDCYFMIGPARA